MTFKDDREQHLASLQQTTELEDGFERITELMRSGIVQDDWNEAQTRFQIIDRVLIECLGYPRSQIRCEEHAAGEYADYVIGTPSLAIWEAKRLGKQFEIPVSKTKRLIRSLKSLAKVSDITSEALGQVNKYCVERGVEVAVASNGSQIIAFLAQPVDLTSELQGNAVVFDSLKSLTENFGRAWQLLSFQALIEGRLADLLKRSANRASPEKLSSSIPGYPQYRSRNSLETSLKNIGELLLLNIDEQEEIEKSFYEECYAESGALSQDSLVSKNILAARYSSLFEISEVSPDVSPVKEKKKGKDLFTPDLLANAIASKPVILLGDVGVGKSSFIKHLRYVSAFDEFRRAIYIYINLGKKGILQQSLRDVILAQIEETLRAEHDIEVEDREFIKDVYKDEIRRFDRGLEGEYKDTDPTRYKGKLVDYLTRFTQDRAEHLRRSIKYLSSKRRKQIILAIDNADQRSDDIQQEAFLIAQNLAADWSASVFISMRPSTYFKSKKMGTLAAYQNRVFTISPPRIDVVLQKRIKFAIDVARGRKQLQQLSDVTLKLGNIASILKVMLNTITEDQNVKAFLDNMSGGNVREIIEFIANCIGSPNLDTETIIRVLADRDSYSIPVWDFWKVALRGDYAYFNAAYSFGANLFDTVTLDKTEHFIGPLIIAYLDHHGIHRSSDGFVETKAVRSEMQSLGFPLAVIDSKLRRMNNSNLIEANHRTRFDEDEAGLGGALPDKLRATSKGVYHASAWMCTFQYLDAVVVDVPIFDGDTRENLRENIRSLSFDDRLSRASVFKDYLTSVWDESSLKTSYFDWHAKCQVGKWTFDRARSALASRNASAGVR